MSKPAPPPTPKRPTTPPPPSSGKPPSALPPSEVSSSATLAEQTLAAAKIAEAVAADTVSGSVLDPNVGTVTDTEVKAKTTRNKKTDDTASASSAGDWKVLAAVIQGELTKLPVGPMFEQITRLADIAERQATAVEKLEVSLAKDLDNLRNELADVVRSVATAPPQVVTEREQPGTASFDPVLVYHTCLQLPTGDDAEWGEDWSSQASARLKVNQLNYTPSQLLATAQLLGAAQLHDDSYAVHINYMGET